MILCFR